MSRHKYFFVVMIFMLIFVQSGVYFSGSQLEFQEHKEKYAGYMDSQNSRDFPAIDPLVLKETKLSWIRDKKADFSLLDFPRRIFCGEEGCQEKKIYGWKKERVSETGEKYGLISDLRAPPVYNRNKKQYT